MVYIKPSKSGRGRIVPLSEEGRAFFDEITTGKHGAGFVFTKGSGARWGANHHARPLQDACKNGKISPAITFHDLRHTYLWIFAELSGDMPVKKRGCRRDRAARDAAASWAGASSKAHSTEAGLGDVNVESSIPIPADVYFRFLPCFVTGLNYKRCPCTDG